VTAAPESVFFRSGDLRMHALRFAGGSGRDLVVVPGITTPAASFGTVAKRLAGLPGVGSVYVLDTRGRGLSEKTGFGSHRSADYAEDLLALIESAGLDSPVLIGHSLGGRVVAAARARFPGCSAGVIVIDPPMSGPGRAPYPIPLERMLNGVQQARAGRGREQARVDYPAWSEEQVCERGDWLGSCDEAAVAEGFAWFHLEPFEPTWQTVLAPALMLVGDKSPVVTPEGADLLAELNPQASVTSVSGCGHMVPWDNTDETISAVGSFLAALS
jgi:N-formylmaleamate deformylase